MFHNKQEFFCKGVINHTSTTLADKYQITDCESTVSTNSVLIVNILHTDY